MNADQEKSNSEDEILDLKRLNETNLSVPKTTNSLKDGLTPFSGEIPTPLTEKLVGVEIKQPALIYLLLNGKSNQIVVTNPEFKNGKLVSIENLHPFSKRDTDGNPITPTVDDANDLKRKVYREFFKKPFRNMLILSGAGSSVDVGLPLMTDLWDIVKNELGEKVFGEICTKISYLKNADFEALISRIEGFVLYNEDLEIEKRKLSDYLSDILAIIRRETSISRPEGKFPHVQLLQKLLQRKQTSSRVKVFTLNYDLLFEKAANEINAVIIDGFSFTSPRTFSGRFFDYDIVQREGSKVNEEDNFIARVFHLYKLHGSLNWHKDHRSGNIIINDNTEAPLMVYPREGKYKDSYGQPFFEMMARFQRNLRQDNDTLLVCVGYSFSDNHINAAIEEAINQNPGFRLAVIDPYFSYTNTQAYKNVINEAMDSERILIVSESFTDFADFYPEIQTYNNDTKVSKINLRNDAK